jgi:hypothetical protein
VLAAWASLVGLGTFGTFSDDSAQATTGIRDDAAPPRLRATGSGQSLSLPADGLLPGGSRTRLITLSNDGGAELSSIVLTTVATTSSVLDTDRSSGLRTTVESCSVPWTEEAACTGVRRTQLSSGPAVRTEPLDGPASLLPGRRDHLAVTVSLPPTAGDAFQGRRSALTLSFTALPR